MKPDPDALVDELSDADFADLAELVIRESPVLTDAGRAVMRKLRRPRESKLLRAEVRKLLTTPTAPAPPARSYGGVVAADFDVETGEVAA